MGNKKIRGFEDFICVECKRKNPSFEIRCNKCFKNILKENQLEVNKYKVLLKKEEKEKKILIKGLFELNKTIKKNEKQMEFLNELLDKRDVEIKKHKLSQNISKEK